MSHTFFISDLHLGHKKVIEFEKEHRPFATIEEHNEEIIKRWNNAVTKKDSVWVLGDFCFGKSNLELAARLNGTKRLVLGNHDMYPAADYLKYFTRVCGVVEFDGKILSHIPVHPSQLEKRYTHNIHGHLHSKKLEDNRYINVSAEQCNLTPVAYEELQKLCQK
jgi:calcineurin-like phosphoesterase family protein